MDVEDSQPPVWCSMKKAVAIRETEATLVPYTPPKIWIQIWILGLWKPVEQNEVQVIDMKTF